MLCIVQNHKGEFHHFDLCYDCVDLLKKAGFLIQEDEKCECEVVSKGDLTEYTYIDKETGNVLGKEILTEAQWKSRVHY